ncbi:hypothetical protein EV424DRAFT_1350647, partial [Suillus variegatus]
MSSLRKYGSSSIRQVSEAGKRLRRMFSSPMTTTTEVRIHAWHQARLNSSRLSSLVSSDQSLGAYHFKIFQKCLWFRILVIGKSGLGKSSLISYAFGVGKEIFAHNKLVGKANINKELISPRNERRGHQRYTEGRRGPSSSERWCSGGARNHVGNRTNDSEPSTATTTIMNERKKSR